MLILSLMRSCICSQVSTVAMAQRQGHFGYQIVRITKTSCLQSSVWWAAMCC